MARFTHPGTGNGSGEPGPQGPQGDTGPAGPQGIQGETGATGPTPFTIIGAYDNGASYNLGIAVYYNGGTYVRTGNPLNPGYPPTFGAVNESWTPIAEKGADGEDGADGAPGGFGYYGSFYDVQTQSLTQQQESTGIPVLIRNTDTDATQGFSVVNNSKITAANAGIYNIAFSLQLHNTGGGGSGITVEIWLSKNGTNVPDTNTRVTVNTNSPYVVSAWNFFQKLEENDYIELMWSTDNHHIVMPHNTGTMGGPSIPSAIITVNQVG